MLQRQVFIYLMSLIPFLSIKLSCSSTSDRSSGFRGGDELVGFDRPPASGSTDDSGMSANNVVFTYSLSNNALTTKQVDTSRASNAANRVSRAASREGQDNRREVVNLIALRKFSGANLDEVFAVARQLATSEMQRDIRRQIPEQAKLELALAAIHARRFSMAEFWLNEISDSKNSRVRAAELTARGIIAMNDQRLPEAVDFWNQALRRFPNYEPARLNLGMIALTYGDAVTAKKMLGNMQNDFLATVGLMQAERLSGNVNRVESLCQRLKSQNSNYKPALFSCALNTYQGQGNLQRARQELEAAARASIGGSNIDERIFKVIGRLDSELRAAQASSQESAKQQGSQQQGP